ncbi:hypothetical protein HYN48_13185 [Flavobacterium magnum]|uniref:Uncharacterized protein n=1 Tax=Flavobacterium magnum TaxID=2162713 RepID=A0A2S0RGS0_9FLAO|nr:hypothetical protein HYN48_13185 [Flavobacterium magnum]
MYSRNINFAINKTLKFLKFIIPGLLVICLLILAITRLGDFIGISYDDKIVDEVGVLIYFIILTFLPVLVNFVKHRRAKFSNEKKSSAIR